MGSQYQIFAQTSIGMILMMLLYMLFRSLLYKDKAYFFYAIYLFCFLLFFVISKLGWSETDLVGMLRVNYLRIAFQIGAYVFYFYFIILFLNLKELAPKVYRVFKLAIPVVILYVLWVLANFFIKTPLNIIFTTFLIIRLFLIGVSVFAIVKTAKLNNPLANFFVYGNSVFLFFMLVALYFSIFPAYSSNLSIDEVLFYFVPLTYAYIAVILESLFFALGLSYKAHSTEIEKRKLQETFTSQLEKEVKDRTEEIIELKEKQFEYETLQAVTIERNRIARDMHDDVSSGLSAINLLANYIQTAPLSKNIETEVKHIAQSSSDINQRIREIIWSVNSESDNLLGLVSFMRRYAAEFGDIHHLDCIVHATQPLPDWHLSGDVRRNLFLCVKESLNNAAKYAQTERIDILVETNANELKIRIKDNGQGFDYEKAIQKGGNGLKNIHNRMQQLVGTATFFTEGQAEVVLDLKINQ